MPTKEDYIKQIEADLKNEGGESSDVLNERLSRVEAAKDNDAAKAAYFGHLEELREQEAADDGRSDLVSDSEFTQN